MIRQIEYYTGILFLTTNLPDRIDEAFHSRIKLHLPYPALTNATRYLLWKDSLSSSSIRGAYVKVSDEEIRELARWDLNGRVIKNAVMLCLKWCYVKKEDVCVEHLERAIILTAPSSKKRDISPSILTGAKRARKD